MKDDVVRTQKEYDAHNTLKCLGKKKQTNQRATKQTKIPAAKENKNSI